MSHQGHPPGAPSGPPPPAAPPFIGPPGHGPPGYGPPGYGSPGYGGAPPPPPRKSNAVIWVVVIVGLVVGCGVFASLGIYGARRFVQRSEEAKRAADQDDSNDDEQSDDDDGGKRRRGKTSKGGGTVLRATDGLSELTLPRSFRSMPELETEGVIRAGDNAGNQFAIVLTEVKTDFAPEVDLEKYGELITTAMKSKLAHPKISAGTPVKIGSLQGLQYEVSGAVDLINITYLVTVVDGAKHYHQVLIWTSPSKFASLRSSFQRATATFREL